MREFTRQYKEFLSRYILQGAADDVLFEAFQHLTQLLDASSVQAADILDVHNQALKDVLNVRNDNDLVQWVYIERATEFLAQVLIATDSLLLSLKETVERDPLTGLYNRMALDRLMSKLWSEAKDGNTPVTVAMLDLDNFKDVNDRCGHMVGDEVLKEIACIIRRNLRDGDLVMRYGGEEFIILLPGTDCASAVKPLERIRDKIEAQEFTEDKIRITASIGASSLP